MRSTSLLALASGLPSTLLWTALLGIAAFAVVLYIPQRFSGPLTARERRTFGRVHRRTLAVVLVTPLATILGFMLLLPPLVDFQVAGHLAGTPTIDASDGRSLLSYFSSRRSTRAWMEAIQCRIGSAHQGPAALAEAIVEAAEEGFSTSTGCVAYPRPLDTWETTSIELSLVELASRAYHLTGLHISAGPRLQDPDPWDIMAQRIEARGGPTPTLGRSRPTVPGASRILRLSHARLGTRTSAPRLTVFALVEGPAGNGFHGSLVTPDGGIVDSECRLDEPRPFKSHEPMSRRIMQLHVRCPELTEQALENHTSGLLLIADDGETPIRSLGRRPPLRVDIDDMRGSLALANNSDAFIDELHRRGLAVLTPDISAAIKVSLGSNQVELSRHDGVSRPLLGCSPKLDSGPFSWSGIEKPAIHVGANQIKIDMGASFLNTDSADYEPSVFLALTYTITWAANALDSGICSETEGRLPGRRQAYPVLTAEQIDMAVAALRRDRDSLGLVLLALALASLALGLRRSAV